ncbi:sister chromatid cohesion protein PDS5 homolog A-like [Fopius arisanus]|uniref:Sister chromatid cohesion protein PDS5 homolog A-like n=1 Tax=Fopius arisanus TaxID=64838 RepID=A0A9R1T119_9HYME|nr:PREDICTED: sister chromatid cohesion protein PDS5 homolog A-like [Fopius arisanus]
MLRVQFPPGTKLLTKDLEETELEKRLSVLSNNLKIWKSADPIRYEEYKPLAEHLSKSDPFLTHPNKFIQLSVALCLSDILRGFAPTSPFPHKPDVLLRVLNFLASHLAPLKDPSSPWYSSSEYILANLTRANAFALCSDFSELPATPKSLRSFVILLFDIINANPAGDVHRLINKLITNLINSSQEIVKPILPVLFLHLLITQDSYKSSHNLSRKILSTSKALLAPLLSQDFVQILISFGTDDLLRQVSSITSAISRFFPKILEHILPQLEALLNSEDDAMKLRAVIILSSVLQDKDSNFSGFRSFWKLFVSAFLAQPEGIRIICIKEAKPFLLSDSMRSEIIEILTLVQRDYSLLIRKQIISTIMSAVNEDFSLLEDQELLSIIKARSLDKDYEVRKHTLKELSIGFLSSRVTDNSRDSDLSNSAMISIMNEVLRGYFVKDEKDRMYVERIFTTWFSKFQEQVEVRVALLYHFFDQIDKTARRAFAELQIHRWTIRKCLTRVFESREELRGDLELTVARNHLKSLSKYFADTIEVETNLLKFFEDLNDNPSLAEDMEQVLMPNVTCLQSEEAINRILRNIGDLNETDPYYKTVKILLERSSSVLIDETAIEALITCLHDVLHDDEAALKIGLNLETAVENGFKLLEILSLAFSAHFANPTIFNTLATSLLRDKTPSITVRVLNILTNVGKIKQLNRISSTWTALVDTCKSFLTSGTVAEAKASVRLISGLSGEQPAFIFQDVVEKLEDSLDGRGSRECTTLIASLGYISWFYEDSNEQIYSAMKSVYVQVLGPDESHASDESHQAAETKNWSEKEELPLETICRLEAMKCLTRWVISRQVHESWILEIIRVLMRFVASEGNARRLGGFKADEKSWLRLQAGACLLKLAKFERTGDKLKTEHFFRLSGLMIDDVYEVRKRFQEKLGRGLTRKCPRECLPIDFVGFYALAGIEGDETLKEGLRTAMIRHFKKREENLEKCCKVIGAMNAPVVDSIRPESGIIYAVVILANWRKERTGSDKHLMGTIRGLEFVLEYWLEKTGEQREKMISFFRQLFKRLRMCRDAKKPDDEGMAARIQTVCDVAVYCLGNFDEDRTGFGEEVGDVAQLEIPTRYLQFDEELLKNPEDTFSRDVLMERLRVIDTKKKNKQRRMKKKNDSHSLIERIFGVRKGMKRKSRDAI